MTTIRVPIFHEFGAISALRALRLPRPKQAKSRLLWPLVPFANPTLPMQAKPGAVLCPPSMVTKQQAISLPLART